MIKYFTVSFYTDWYLNLSTMQQLSFSSLMFNSIIFIYIVNIIFVLFGESLIKKFSLESSYPKLAKYLELKIKLNSNYMKINFLMMINFLLTEIMFSMVVLSS